MRYLSLFSGIEAATVAWEPLGWQAVAFAEVDPFCCALLSTYYPGVPNLGDVTTVDWSAWQGKADVLVGGSPCQAFSVAGLRQSLKDPRGNLTLEFVRAANAIQPGFILWENVPGVLSTEDNAFGCFLAALVGADEAILPERGWTNSGVVSGPERTAAWVIKDAQFFRVAQRRRRVFVLAVRGSRNWTCAEALLPLGEGLCRDTPPRRKARQATPGGAVHGAEVGPSGGRFTDLAPTLDARCKDSAIRNQIGLLVFGGNNTSGPIGVAAAVNAHGGAGRMDFETETICVEISPPLLAGANRTGGDRFPGMSVDTCESLIAHTLRGDGFDASEDGSGRGTPLIPVAFSAKDYGADLGGMAPTLRAMPHDRSHANAGGQVAVCVQEGQTGVREHETAGTVRSDAPGTQPGGSLIRDRYAVRRLTPRECERLQGFPDDYTLIPNYRKKLRADEVSEMAAYLGIPLDEARQLGATPDGPRYKAIGNSMAVPVMHWIGRRIVEAHRKMSGETA